MISDSLRLLYIEELADKFLTWRNGAVRSPYTHWLFAAFVLELSRGHVFTVYRKWNYGEFREFCEETWEMADAWVWQHIRFE